MGFRNGQLRSIPVGKEGAGKPPKILAIAFAGNWRDFLQRGQWPLAIGTEDEIQIWHEESVSNWKCYYVQKCHGGARFLAWSVNDLSLAYAEAEVLHLVRFDREKDDYTLSEHFRAPTGIIRSVSCNNLAWAVAHSSEILAEDESVCAIIKRSSRSRAKNVKSISVRGSIIRLIPGLPFLLAGGPSSSTLQIYSSKASADSAPTHAWTLVEEMKDMRTDVLEISVFAQESNMPHRNMVAILGSSMAVHIYEFFGFPDTNKGEEGDYDSVKLVYLESVWNFNRGPIPRFVVWEPYRIPLTIAVSYSDGSICIFESNGKQYQRSHSLEWEQHWKETINRSAPCLAWPQPGLQYRFPHPVLATGADHGFMVSYEIAPSGDQFLLRESDRDIDLEATYYYKQRDDSDSISVEIEKTPLDRLKEVFMGTQNQIFCNMPLNMSDIKAVGFEMDVIALYKPELLSSISWDALKRLIAAKEYPKQLTRETFNFNPLIKGLVIDIERGNLLKMDKGMCVHISFHGSSPMTPEEVQAVYGTMPVKERFDGTKYVRMDTFFSLCEGLLFVELVDIMDKKPGIIPPKRRTEKDYERLYIDIRSVFETLHRDGTIKGDVTRLPGWFMTPNPEIVTLLHRFRKDGVKTFLISSSLWHDTEIIMGYTCQTFSQDKRRHSWVGLFDAVILSRGGLKQTFFDSYKEQDIFEMKNTGSLHNVLDVQVSSAQQDFFDNKIYQGGDIGHLLTRLGLNCTSQVLFVSHEITGGAEYKMKAPCWRTLLVIPELKGEFEANRQCRIARKELIILRQKSDRLENQIHFLQRMIDSAESVDLASIEHLDKLLNEQPTVKKKLEDLQEQLSHLSQSNGSWGQILKTGNINSRFAHEVVQHASLYTDSATNLSLYHPKKRFDVSANFMQHEMELFDDEE